MLSYPEEIYNFARGNAAYLPCRVFFNIGNGLYLRVDMERAMLEHWRNIMRMAVDEVLEEYPEWGEDYEPFYIEKHQIYKENK